MASRDRLNLSGTLLRLEGLEVGYGRPILPPLHAEIRCGEMWVLLGTNGSGKTTVLRTVLGLLPRLGGQLRWEPGVRVGYVPQRASLLAGVPSRARDVVQAGFDQGWSFLSPARWFGGGDAVRAALDAMGVLGLANLQFDELSEGQKQRVLMAQALVTDPHVLVLDEPTSAMDMRAERSVFELLEGLRRERGMAVVLVSHQIGVVGEFATHAMFLDREEALVHVGALAAIAAEPAWQARFGRALDPGMERRAMRGASHG